WAGQCVIAHCRSGSILSRPTRALASKNYPAAAVSLRALPHWHRLYGCRASLGGLSMSRETSGQITERGIDHRNNQEGEESAGEHATHNRNPHGAAALSARPKTNCDG